MGNGTTCNLQLVKQNAKKKGEVSTGLFLLSFFLCFPHTSTPHNTPLRRECTPSATPTTATTTAECKWLFTGIKSGRMEVKDLGGPTREKKKTEKGRDTEEATCGARRRRAASGEGRSARRRRSNAAWQRQNLFITTAPSLSPSRTANANVGHLGKK